MSEAKPSYLGYVKELPLQEALWWFIENASDDLPERSSIFFALRERMREQRADSTAARYRAEQTHDNFGSPAEFMEMKASEDRRRLLELPNPADLRNQALELIERATVIDRLQPYVLAHEHSYGTTTYLAWFDHFPSETEAVSVLDCKFEPDREETLTIEPVTDLKNLVAAQ
jgi:predicted RNA-binding Zn ribbon-like protein